MRLILASRSPRRQELLRSVGIDFVVSPPDETVELIDIAAHTGLSLVRELALRKAKSVAEHTRKGLILAADTVAQCGEDILGKPTDRQHAFHMLSRMSGQVHYVHTGLCLWSAPSGEHRLETDSTRLRMSPLDENQINDYLDSGLWKGKAGAFGYQDQLGWVQVEQGSPSNVVGLPLELLKRMLESFPQEPSDKAVG